MVFLGQINLPSTELGTPGEEPMISDFVKVFAKMLLIVTVLLTVGLYFLSMSLQPILMLFTQQGITISSRTVTALPIWFFSKTAYLPLGLNLGVVFLALWAAITASFVFAWKLKDSFHSVVKNGLVQPTKKLFSSCLFAMPVLNSMMLIAVLLIQSLQEAGGIPTGSPSIPANQFEALVDLSYASVIEEVIFRLVPIGAFLIVYVFWAGKNIATASRTDLVKIFVVAPFFPDKAKQWAGAKTVKENGVFGGISINEWGMIAITAVIFGVAHFNPGVSWELGKITSSGMVGFVLAVIYIVYGIQASIIMHWFFNAFTDTFIILADLYPATAPIVNIVTVTTYILGAAGYLLVAWLGVRKIVNARKQKQQNQATSSVPVPLE